MAPKRIADWLFLFRKDPAFIRSRLPQNVWYLQIVGILMLIMECGMLAVYALSQKQILPTLSPAYAAGYLTAIAASVSFLAVATAFRGRETVLRIAMLVYISLLGVWSIGFAVYDVSQGNSSYIFSQILILIAVGICGRPWLHCLINGVAYGAFVTLLRILLMDDRRFYNEAINMLIIGILACVIVLYSYYERHKLYLNACKVEEQNHKLHYYANYDTLTAVLNRRAVLSRLHDRVSGGDGSVFVAMIDIDHFKRYNDTYGHLAGDRCLKQIAEVLAAYVDRWEGTLGRYGGEEFVVILTGQPAESIPQIMDGLLQAVNTAAIPFEKVPQKHVTVSAGGCIVRTRQDTETILTLADRALYRAKQTGRNRFFMEDPGQAAESAR